MDTLNDEQIAQALGARPAWTREGDTIRREVEAPEFLTGIEYVREIGAMAEEAGHHPDIDIRWRTLTFVLTSHEAGGLTRADFDLAAGIDAVVDRPATP